MALSSELFCSVCYRTIGSSDNSEKGHQSKYMYIRFSDFQSKSELLIAEKVLLLNLMLEILLVCQMFHNTISMNSLLFRSMSILLALLRRRHSDSQDNNETQRTFLLYICDYIFLSKASIVQHTLKTRSPNVRSPKAPLATRAADYISVYVAVTETAFRIWNQP